MSYAIVDQKWKLVTNEDSSHNELYDLAAPPKAPPLVPEERRLEVAERLGPGGELEKWQATLPSKPSGAVFSGERSK